MDAVEHQRRSDRALLDCFLHCSVLRVEAAHEPDLDEPPAEGGFRIEDRRAIRFGRRHRLLAEDRFAGPNRGHYIGCVRISPRRDDDRVNIVGRDEFFAGRISLRSGNFRRDLLGPCGVGVAHCDNSGACKRLGQPANMLLPDLARSDDADV